MVAKSILFFCAQALMVKLITASCNSNNAFESNNFVNVNSNSNAIAANNNAFAASNAFAANNNAFVANNNFGNSAYGLGNIAANNGGGLAIQSFSPIAPTGVNVQSSNTMEGGLAVEGNLPFLSAVALEGQVSTAGQGNVAYSCGNANSGIVSESYGPNALINNGLAYGAGIANADQANAGLANAGLVSSGYANAGLANAGLVNSGYANAGLANAGLVNSGYANAALANAALANAGIANINNVGVAGNCNGLN